MDSRFQPAITAMKTGNVNQLRQLITADPSLATGRSSTSHPTLLQCLVLAEKGNPHKIEMAEILIDAGAELSGPLVASCSCENVELVALLLDRGAAADGTGGWSPLEEALYWNSQDVAAVLLRRGAGIKNLRVAAGLGRTDLIENFFNTDGSLRPEAGTINWPWGDLAVIEQSNFDPEGKKQLAARFTSWGNDRQSIINNAFVYACMHGQIDAAKLLLQKGVEIDAIPGGFDYAGTGLHYAALNGHGRMVEFLLENGADASIKDTKVGGTPAGWAEYGGHPEINRMLTGA